MRKKYLILGLAALLVFTAVAGGSLAALNAVGDVATSELEAPNLRVDIDHIATAATTLGNGKIMPGDNLDCKGFVITNTAEVPLYARVTVTKYWTDGNQVKDPDVDAKMIQMTADKTGWLQANEVLVGSSGEQEIYYLSRPLSSGESYDLPLKLFISPELGNAAQDAGITIEARVDGVQYVAGENELNAGGILSFFGVEAKLNGDGSIASVTQ